MHVSPGRTLNATRHTHPVVKPRGRPRGAETALTEAIVAVLLDEANRRKCLPSP
jgi:hypothetical protein